MRSARFFACVAVAAASGGLGCSSGSSTPTSSQYDDVAQSTAAILIQTGGGGEMGSMSESASIAIGATPSGVTVDASGSLDCVHAGVTYTFQVSCTDVHGAALAHCGPTTNDAQASVAWSGNLSLTGFNAAVNRSGNWTLTGVQTSTATFNGTGTFNFNAQFQSAFRNEMVSANLSYSGTYNAITYDTALHHATGGSAHYTIDGSHAASSTGGTSNGSFAVDALVTFAADGSAKLTLDATHQYLLSAGGTVIKI
jgi:hypothetical protein